MIRTKDEILDAFVASENIKSQLEDAATTLNTQAEVIRVKYEADLQTLKESYTAAIAVVMNTL